jgi:hypothetical protein
MPKKEEFIQWLHSAETKSVYSNERFAWHFFCCCVLAIRLTVAALLRLPPLKKLHLKEKMRKSRIGHIRWWALHLASGFLLASWLWVYSVEPSDHIDSAMHEFTGKMPIEKGGFFDVEVRHLFARRRRRRQYTPIHFSLASASARESERQKDNRRRQQTPTPTADADADNRRHYTPSLPLASLAFPLASLAFPLARAAH